MVQISQRLAIYYVNPDSMVYGDRFVKLALKKFSASMTIPHTVTMINIENPLNVSIDDLKPLTSDIALVFIPSKSYHLSIQVHSGTTIIYTSFHPANSRYAKGSHYTALTLLRYFLLEGREFSFEDTIYKKVEGDGRALLIAAAVTFKSIEQLNELYTRIKKWRIPSRMKSALLHIVVNKKKKVMIGGKECRVISAATEATL